MKNQLVLKELSTTEVIERLENERALYQKMLLSHDLRGGRHRVMALINNL